MEAGQVCPELLILEEGLLRIFTTKSEVEFTYTFAGEGSFVTALSSFISGNPSHESIQFLEDSSCYVVTREQLLNLYQKFPEVEKFGREFFERLCAELIDRLIVMLSESAEERYERILKESPQLVERVPQKLLARFLGITPQSLSRIRKHSP